MSSSSIDNGNTYICNGITEVYDDPATVTLFFDRSDGSTLVLPFIHEIEERDGRLYLRAWDRKHVFCLYALSGWTVETWSLKKQESKNRDKDNG